MELIFDYSQKVISLLQDLSRMEGELQGLARGTKDNEILSLQAAMEGRSLFHEAGRQPLDIGASNCRSFKKIRAYTQSKKHQGGHKLFIGQKNGYCRGKIKEDIIQ